MKDRENNNPKAEQRLPTTFELSQLAVMVRAQLHTGGHEKRQNMTEQILAVQGKAKPLEPFWEESVHLALELWEAAEVALGSRSRAREQLRALRQGLLTLTAEEWKAHVADYQGRPGDIDDLLDRVVVETETIKRKLFRDKTLTAKQRDALFLGLLKFAKDREMTFSDERPFCFPPHARVEATTARECRHFVEARQQQLSLSRSRIMPSRK